MPALSVYQQVYDLLDAHLDEKVDAASRERITLLVVGIIGAKGASPSRIADALSQLGLSDATPESIERRIRRIENDDELTAVLCIHPFIRERLVIGKPEHLLLIIDPTTQEDLVVMVTVSVWYRGRSLPLVWTTWPANQPLEGDSFWERIESLIQTIQPLLPKGVEITWLADRAFGTPMF